MPYQFPQDVSYFQCTKRMMDTTWNKPLSAVRGRVGKGRRQESGVRSQELEGRSQKRGWVLGISLFVTLCCLGLVLFLPEWAIAAPLTTSAPIYEQRPIHNPDGIGKFYMRREIAQVMGHQGAGWLERSSREREERPQRLLDNLGLKATDVVADIGAGTGYFSFRIAPLVSEGKVLAVDVQPEMIEILQYLKQEKQIANVEPVLGTVDNPNLPPSSVDLAIMVDAYHEFEYPREMMTAIAQALKPDGRVVLVEYRAEDPRVFIKPLHKMSQRQVRKEMAAVGLNWLETKTFLPQQHVMVFGKSV